MKITMTVQELYLLYLQHPVVTTDTRNCPQGAIYFALKGSNFDGNAFIDQALDKGCSYAVGDAADIPDNDQVIRVKDSLQTLQELANYHRKQLNTPVIAITGTNGKTTTKELIAAVLSIRYPILFTQGNLNNHIGVPLTLLQLKPEHRFAVIEMGANHQGEIAELAAIAEPNYGLITNVGKAHLEGFGSFEGVVKTKGELYEYIRKTSGKVFVNHENPYLNGLLKDLDSIFYGQSPYSFIWGEILFGFPFLELKWHRGNQVYNLKTRLVGEYNLENALAAIAIGCYFEVPETEIGKAIENYVPVNNRSQFQETAKNHLIIDAYNANPTSMMASLENFEKTEVRPKMLLLGDMRELGEYSREEHQKIIDFVKKSKFEKVFFCGEIFTSLHMESSPFVSFEKVADLLQFLQDYPVSGYHILIKGSRGIQLEKVIGLL